MPRIKRTQKKEVEKFLIREFFVDALGCSISKPDWTEGPDAILTLRTNGVRKRIGIEHTGYFNDTVAGKCSPLTPIEMFWKDVQASLMRRVSHRKHLCGIDVRVTLKNNLLVSNHDPESAKQKAKRLAKNLVAFLESHPIRLRKPEFFKRRKRGDSPFGDYPFLDSYLSSVFVSRHLDIAASTYRTCWTCNNLSTGAIGINLDYIKSAIKKKNKKAVKYEWKNAKEKWLLIVAGSGNVSQGAGRLLQEAIFDDDKLITLCRESPFDNIVFWERVRCWYKNLKPIKKAVRYKNPYPFATPST